MSSSASTSKPVEPKVEKDKEEEKTEEKLQVNTLGLLEEDDEFEEFETADWDDSQTDMAHLNGAAPGAAKSGGGDKLWEDNWDDDDIEDEFSVQLRNELAKTGKSGGPGMEQ